MKKITLLLLSMVFAFTQAQDFSTIRSNGGAINQQQNARTVTDWLHYDGDNSSRLGNPNNAHTIGAYIKLTSTLLAPHIGRQIEELQFYIGDAATLSGDVEIRIYNDLSASPVYTQTVVAADLVSNDWNTIILTTPFQINSTQEFYIGYYYEYGAGYFAGIDDGSSFVSDVNYLVFNGTTYELGAAGLPKNWNIRAGVGGATATNDAGLTNAVYDPIMTVGTFNVTATIINYGSTTLNSIDFNYQVDGGTVNTDNLTGLNLATGQSTTVTHSVPWTATVGAHNFDVYTSNFNGNGADDIPANDHQIFTISVASNTTQNLPLFEEFTSSTCAPCAGFNSNSFNTAFLNNNTGHYSLIKYQMNWPAPGDAYYTAEGGVRRAYYGVVGVPTLFLEGNGDDPNFFQNPGELQPQLDAAYAAPAYFEMSAIHTINVTDEKVYVKVDVNPFLTGNFTLHCAVVEKTTTGNVGNNGETEFHNVMMKMVPDASGTPASFVVNTPKTFYIEASLNGTHIEDWNDLEVVVFLQNDSDKKVMQSAVAVEDANSIEDVVFNQLNIYPTPTQNVLHISNAAGMQISIFSLNGSLLYQKDDLTEQNNLNLPNLTNGVYLAKFTKDGKTAVRKLIISK